MSAHIVGILVLHGGLIKAPLITQTVGQPCIGPAGALIPKQACGDAEGKTITGLSPGQLILMGIKIAKIAVDSGNFFVIVTKGREPQGQYLFIEGQGLAIFVSFDISAGQHLK